MRECPRCDLQVLDTATECPRCGLALPPEGQSVEPTEEAEAQDPTEEIPVSLAAYKQPNSGVQYFQGAGIGCLGLIGSAALVGATGAAALAGYLTAAIYLAMFVGALVCLFRREVRWIGYGLLSIVVGLPIIAGVSCLVILSNMKF